MQEFIAEIRDAAGRAVEAAMQAAAAAKKLDVAAAADAKDAATLDDKMKKLRETEDKLARRNAELNAAHEKYAEVRGKLDVLKAAL